MVNNKLYIAGVTKAGELDNLKELLLPLYPYYDGLQWTFNLPTDEGYDFLNSIKKDGKIILNEWNYRLDDCRNRYLFCGTMKTGDFFINLDSLERLSPKFFELWPQLRQFLIQNNIDGVVLYGKRFLYRYSEYLQHFGNPHEWMGGVSKTIELTSLEQYKDTSWFWSSVRNEKRDSWEFIFHYLSYLINFPTSNQAQLGNESKPEQYKIEEITRIQFRLYLEKNNYLPITKEKFIWLCNNKLDDIREWLNKSKILNDAARYLWLNRTDFKDDHNYLDMIKIR